MFRLHYHEKNMVLVTVKMSDQRVIFARLEKVAIYPKTSPIFVKMVFG